MPDFINDEAFRIWIINMLSEGFPDNAILKGGMTLRLLDSPRYTNYIDYTFIPFKSKKDIKEIILKYIKSILNVSIDNIIVNSKCLNIIISNGKYKCSLEINVANY